MYICLCNPFTDKEVRSYLGCCQGRASVGQVYRACSGGESPNCCSCMETLREMVRDHNTTQTVREMTAGLPKDTAREEA